MGIYWYYPNYARNFFAPQIPIHSDVQEALIKRIAMFENALCSADSWKESMVETGCNGTVECSTYEATKIRAKITSLIYAYK